MRPGQCFDLTTASGTRLATFIAETVQGSAMAGSYRWRDGRQAVAHLFKRWRAAKASNDTATLDALRERIRVIGLRLTRQRLDYPLRRLWLGQDGDMSCEVGQKQRNS